MEYAHACTHECKGPSVTPKMFRYCSAMRDAVEATGTDAFMSMESCRVGWRFGGMEGGFGYQADHWPAAQMAAALPRGLRPPVTPWPRHAATNA